MNDVTVNDNNENGYEMKNIGPVSRIGKISFYVSQTLERWQHGNGNARERR